MLLITKSNMRTIINLVVIIAALYISGCATYATQSRPTEYYGVTQQTAVGESLFTSDAAVLSDVDIEKNLNYQYKSPKLSRIAILPFGWSSWVGWSEEISLATKNIEANVIQELIQSNRIYDASFLPSILIPDKRTVPYLRESAARYQADLLLIYRTDCRSFEKYRLLREDKGRAYCSVESVLLDTRTGLIPLVAVSSQTYEIVQQENDINFNEARIRSQLTAVETALAEITTRVRGFIDSSRVG